MTKAKRWTLITSLVLSLTIVGAAMLYSLQKHSVVAPIQQPQRAVGMAELKAADGKYGHICYVAVDGLVYQIQGFALWQNGKHLTSNGLAYCGADLSKVIDQAPHGRRVLDILIKVGPLTA